MPNITVKCQAIEENSENSRLQSLVSVNNIDPEFFDAEKQEQFKAGCKQIAKSVGMFPARYTMSYCEEF